MAPDEQEPEMIDASPTKQLFIDILTRDIMLKDCILDLVDNSIDGYTRRRIQERRKCQIEISPENDSKTTEPLWKQI